MRWKKITGCIAIGVVFIMIALFGLIATYDFNRLKPRIVEIVRTHTGREIHLNGDLQLSLGLSPRLTAQSVTFQNAEWGARPDMVLMKQLDIQFELIPLIQGHVRINRLLLIEPDILIERNRSGRSNLEFDFPAGSTGTTSENAKVDKGASSSDMLAIKDVHFERAKFALMDHGTNITKTLRIEELNLFSPGYGDPAEITLEAAYNDTPFRVSGRLGALARLFRPLAPWPVELAVHVLGADITVSGSVEDPLNLKGADLKYSVAGGDLSFLQEIIGRSLEKVPFEISGRLIYRFPEKLDLTDLHIKAADSAVNGAISVERMHAVPLIKAKLQSDRLDLRPLFGKEEKKPSQGKVTQRAEDNPKVFSSKPLPLDFLNRFETEFDAELVHLMLPGIAASATKLTTILKNGRIDMTLVASKIGNGRLAVTFGIVPQDNKFNVSASVNAENVDLGRMLKDLKVSSGVEGIMNLTVKLKGVGNSIAEMMAGLDGDLIVTTGNGRMPLAYVSLIGTDIGTSMLKLLNPFDEAVDEAAINCLVADFNIAHGRARSDIILIDDPRKTLVGHADIELGTEALSVWIETRPKQGIGFEQTGKFSISLRELTKPFKLGGTLAHPTVELDTFQTAKTIGTALLGPAGIAWLLISGASGEKDPCANAMKIVGVGIYKKEAGDNEKKGVFNKLKNIFN